MTTMREALERIRLIAETDGISQIVEICEEWRQMENHVANSAANQAEPVPQQEGVWIRVTDKNFVPMRGGYVSVYRMLDGGRTTLPVALLSIDDNGIIPRAQVEEITSLEAAPSQRSSPEWRPDPKTVEMCAAACRNPKTFMGGPSTARVSAWQECEDAIRSLLNHPWRMSFEEWRREMGADIHLVLERKLKGGPWVGLLTSDNSKVRSALKVAQRDYEFFAQIAAVRGSPKDHRFYPRNLPEDVSHLAWVQYMRAPTDHHSASHASLSDFCEIYLKVNPDAGRKEFAAYDLFGVDLDWPENADYRVVFWFDN